MGSTRNKYAARVAALSRSRSEDDPILLEARHTLHTAALEEAIQRALDSAPPLSGETRARLASLLSPAGGTER